MYYSSIKEVWGDNFTPENDFVKNSNISNYNEDDDNSEYRNVDKMNDYVECNFFLEHIEKCERCKSALRGKYKKIVEVSTKEDMKKTETIEKIDKSAIEHFSQIRGDGQNKEYNDIIVLILLGIFTIYVLDTIFKLSKKIK